MADDPLAQAVAHKPCPWCGSTMKPEAKLTDGYKWGALSCAECGATAPEVRTDYLESPHWYADALVEWNKRRADDTTLAALHAAREDAARLDWFGNNAPFDEWEGIDIHDRASHHAGEFYANEAAVRVAYGKAIRDIIDAARAANEEGT